MVIVLLGNKKGREKLPLTLEPAFLGRRTLGDEVNGGSFLPIVMCLEGHSSKSFKGKKDRINRCSDIKSCYYPSTHSVKVLPNLQSKQCFLVVFQTPITSPGLSL